MKRTILIIGICILSLHGMAQWIDELRLYPIPTTPQQMNRYNMRVYFPAPGHTFYSYQQGGAHWSAYTIGRAIENYDSAQILLSASGNYNEQQLSDLCFLNGEVAYAAVSEGVNIKIIQTLDSGINWSKVENDVMLWMIPKIAYTRTGFGYYLSVRSSITQALEIIVSDNGSCTKKDFPADYLKPHQFSFLNDSLGFVICVNSANQQVLLRTNDAANSWEEVINNASDTLQSFFFANPQKGYMISRDGFLFTTNDHGKNWAKSTQLTSSPANDVYFADSQKGYIACDNGQLLITVDGGTSWHQQNTGISHHLEQVYFEESEKGFLLDNQDYLHTNFITGLDGISEGKWRLGPNPASELLRINMPANDEKVFIQIFNMQGQAMTAKTAQSGDVIDVSWLRNGLYVIVIEGGGKTTSRKFVKQGI